MNWLETLPEVEYAMLLAVIAFCFFALIGALLFFSVKDFAKKDREL